MKPLVFSIILYLLIPSISVASYIIKLKNGRKISVQHYWNEGGNILFNIYGGTLGIRKNLVKKIEAAEGFPDKKRGTTKQRAIEATDKAKEEDKVREQGKQQKDSEEEKGERKRGNDLKKDVLLKEKKRIMDEMERVSLAFKEAKAGNDKGQKDEYWKKLLLLQKQLSKHKKKSSHR